jgi:hypothetical protein
MRAKACVTPQSDHTSAESPTIAQLRNTRSAPRIRCIPLSLLPGTSTSTTSAPAPAPAKDQRFPLVTGLSNCSLCCSIAYVPRLRHRQHVHVTCNPNIALTGSARCKLAPHCAVHASAVVPMSFEPRAPSSHAYHHTSSTPPPRYTSRHFAPKGVRL